MTREDSNPSKNRKCLYVLSPRLNLSGVSKVAQNVANDLQVSGVNVRYICADNEKNANNVMGHAVHLEFLGLPPTQGVKKIIHIFKLVYAFFRLSQRDDLRDILIWGKEYACLFQLISFFMRRDVRVMGVNANNISAHLQDMNAFSSQVKKVFYRCVMPELSRWIAQSNGIRDEMIADYGVDQANVVTIYPSIDETYFNDGDDIQNRDDILFVGRLEHQKDPLALLELTKDFLRSNQQARLRIVGDGSLREAMVRRVKEYGLEAKVIFEGDVRNPLRFYKTARLLVLTSRYEGFGMVMVEAMAGGVPVLSLDVPSGPREIIQHEENGFLAQGKTEFMRMLPLAYSKEWDCNIVQASVKKFHPDIILPQYKAFMEGDV
jgi:glycosyltransferase involved in cell wall biosynthesis